jgi:hypothetical protein
LVCASFAGLFEAHATYHIESMVFYHPIRKLGGRIGCGVYKKRVRERVRELW